jgi:ATP-dependent RNA helicase SrmB
MIDRIARYTKEEIKERFIDGLRPKHKKPVFKKKKKTKSGNAKANSPLKAKQVKKKK